MSTQLLQIKARILKARGIDITDRRFTSDDYLNAAVNEDEEAQYVGPFDPAFTHYIVRRDDYLMAAELLQG